MQNYFFLEKKKKLKNQESPKNFPLDIFLGGFLFGRRTQSFPFRRNSNTLYPLERAGSHHIQTLFKKMTGGKKSRKKQNIKSFFLS